MRDWVQAFDAQGPDGLIDGKAPGKAPKPIPEQHQALAAIVERGPDPDRDGVMRRRLKDLAAWIRTSFGVSLHQISVERMVKALGFRKLSARPRHRAHDPATPAAIKNTCPPN
ncbi:hypothetical protein MPOCJGCO_2053 [Methylobacterium trifolii]|uniref:Winged helix-turn helix domain-containing protein n=1 Tax=Methylobacterium trifolii TaxID=1003092 RepID=A0ABQ4U279_9HYPH|nr:hypothetical protein MPOCJGCO_2053 [Methylobacterium trifolii]